MNFHYIYHSGLLGAACLLSPAYSGLMADSIDLQTYRDFAENRGVFGINEKDVPIYDKEGNYVGTIAEKPRWWAVPASLPPCPTIMINSPLHLQSVLVPVRGRLFMIPTVAW